MLSIGDLYEYKLENLIGQGAFATVFKGLNKRTNNPVAVKCINKKNLEQTKSLLGKEINILKELNHENIVGLYEYKDTTQYYLLVMEYCNGGDLSDYLRSKGTLSEDTMRHFFRQIAFAMKSMNDRGIIHRDLKPQNLLLSYNKPNPKPTDITVKVADFGFARHLHNDSMAVTLCGSPLYMAPEVITSNKYNAKADLWSVGTIMFQCLVGRSPFRANTPQELKNFYERSQKVEATIPHGTSRLLTDLLVNLLKRKVEERIDFNDFYNHRFFLRSKPMPVPVRSNECFSPSNASSASDCRSVVESPQVEIECSPSVGDPLFLGNSSDSDSDTEDFVMVEVPTSWTEYGSAPQPTVHTRDQPIRKHSMPVSNHKPVVIHRKQISQGSPKKSLEDKEMARAHSKESDARSPFMQRNVHSTVSPITIRYSGGSSRRRGGSGSDSDASSHSRPSPVPTQVGNFQKMELQFAQMHSRSGEEKHTHFGCRPRSGSPLCLNNVPRRFSLDNISPGYPTVCHTLPRGFRKFGSPVEFPTIIEYPVMAKAQEMGIKCVIDNKSETLVAQLARAWTAPNMATLRENSGARHGNPVDLRKQGMAGQSKAVDTQPDVNRMQSIFMTNAVLGHKNSPETEFRFYNQLSDTICEIAGEHDMFQCDVVQTTNKSTYKHSVHQKSQKQGEQLLLYMKSLQLVATALHTLRNKVNAGNLVVTPEIKDIGKELYQRYKRCLKLCERSKLQCEITEKSRIKLFSADKIMYSKAIQDCQSAAVNEKFAENFKSCLQQYERSLVLLEGLSLATNTCQDRAKLSKFKMPIRSRVEALKTTLNTQQAL